MFPFQANQDLIHIEWLDYINHSDVYDDFITGENIYQVELLKSNNKNNVYCYDISSHSELSQFLHEDDLIAINGQKSYISMKTDKKIYLKFIHNNNNKVSKTAILEIFNLHAAHKNFMKKFRNIIPIKQRISSM